MGRSFTEEIESVNHSTTLPRDTSPVPCGDPRDELFKTLEGRLFSGLLTASEAGVLSGEEELTKGAADLGLDVRWLKKEGDLLATGDGIATVLADPKRMALVEERLIGCLAKFSGIATAAKRAVGLAEGRFRVVSGAWKKMPPSLKDGIRQAVVTGGASFRIASGPMVYLDKNFLRMLGGVGPAVEAAKGCGDKTIVVQLKGLFGSVAEETAEAVTHGAGLLMVDTGQVDDLLACLATLETLGRRNQVEVALAGNLKIEDIPSLLGYGLDMVDIGRPIVDAPLLDMRLDVKA
ncbi:MAG: quinolinate phosphoribosyl transferase [Deltaproteobacteria bacterium]|jgi:nicotinate-nucleotide pyrophosphorylase (carboxylating)|nr:quinolinate phosphoribosyl transferase [Deltaproteobacteria bacterium]